MKKCVKCAKFKPLTEYSTVKKEYKGKTYETPRSECKLCRAIRVKSFRGGIKGKALQMWDGINRRAEDKEGTRPSYRQVRNLLTKEDFLKWAIPELNKWSEKHNLSSASVDRINPEKHYELGNLQILSHSENVKKSWKDRQDR